ncbi:hypothetical protein DESC_700150 [Desulfosarcina cetonica]|uniref:hypothetical protein n=1 Tax=Desulfosarcina cetonica TaxID=90730 RepID=UPI0006D1D8DB|nr:hypothetical protein [Desulfosarcina cetonica]VTR68394.1 hypothetical protein DESC_700150 [Desulfosarcina cetonica]
MEIMNLEISILYFLCQTDLHRDPAGTGLYESVVHAFADIPQDDIRTIIDGMVANRLISLNSSGTRLTVTAEGVLHLQASLPCRIHAFDGCRCGLPDPPLVA